ncbi:MAG: DUF177 domain-containing protein [Sciscionella sp.]|nr:DUF177 domain-containing protein [Sciscionella sp.]
MSEQRSQSSHEPSPWVLDTRELARQPGTSRDYHRVVPAPPDLGLAGVIAVDPASDIELTLLLESALEGVLVTGTARAALVGECARCLDPLTDTVEVSLMELYAYPDSTTEQTTDDDEVRRFDGELIDLEPMVRDAIVLSLPQAPLCWPGCPGLCPECGIKWVDLERGHRHEKMDPRWAALRERFGGGEGDPS